MWTSKRDYPPGSASLRLTFLRDGVCLSYEDFLRGLAERALRELLLEELQSAPFTAYCWETPPVTLHTVDRPFSCLLHNNPALDVPADPTDFAAHLRRDAQVACFPNLGRDAMLVVPCPTSAAANYSHIASFHRSAPAAQQHALWLAVANAVWEKLNSRPLWLSTAGGGVNWLHMRLDDRPKYYRHRPWREIPARG